MPSPLWWLRAIYIKGMAHPRYWIKAFRLRTLPLAFSTVWMGSAAAAVFDSFNVAVFVMATATTLFLQILSNLANDYGDAVSGADKTRIGPARMVQSGHITKTEIVWMIVVFSALSLISGLGLLWSAFPKLLSVQGILFFVLGLLSIAAAINYTVGRNPYGYKGWGDFFVFVFFGLVGVYGTFFLHTHLWQPWVFLPAVAIGFLSMGVLNVNNLRDRENDALTGKRSLVVIFGHQFGIWYQFLLVTGAVAALSLFTLLLTQGRYIWLFALVSPLFVLHLRSVLTVKIPRDIDPELKRLSLSTFAVVVFFMLGLYLNSL